MTSEPTETRAPTEKPKSRRSFMSIATLAIGGVIGVVTAVPLVRMFLYPAGRKIVGGSGEAVDAIGLAEIAAGGDPVKVTLTASGLRDAWGSADAVRLGSAWVSRSADGEISALSSACPHLGCAIDFDAADKKFKCPCHRSAFGASGERIEGPSKRGLDPLPARVENGRVLITHKSFEPDIAERVEKS